MKWLVFFILAVCCPVLSSAQSNVFRIDTETLPTGYALRGSNDLSIPIWIAIDFSQLSNLNADQPIPYRGMLPAKAEKVPILNLFVQDPSRSYSYRIVYTHALGDPTTTIHDDAHLYLLPFAHGKKYELSQGFNGAFTHRGENQYAADFTMDEGTEIYSARGGVVVDLKEDSSVGGLSTQYGRYGNYVIIQHGDQSFGSYVHLRKNGVLVEIGDIVPAGALIALSGNTGISSGPHLHFDVRIPTLDGKMQSIPFRIIHARGNGPPEEGQYYIAVHPGKPLPDIQLGSDLRNEDYEGYQQSIALSNKVQVTTERIDRTTVLFLENGFMRAASVEVILNASGVTSSVAFPQTVTIPPRTRLFLAILQPTGARIRIQYTTRITFPDE